MATKTDDYKVVIHFQEHDVVYRTTAENDYKVREYAEQISDRTKGESWTIYRALTTSYMGQGALNDDGSRTPIWVHDIIGWTARHSTRAVICGNIAEFADTDL